MKWSTSQAIAWTHNQREEAARGHPRRQRIIAQKDRDMRKQCPSNDEDVGQIIPAFTPDERHVQCPTCRMRWFGDARYLPFTTTPGAEGEFAPLLHSPGASRCSAEVTFTPCLDAIHPGPAAPTKLLA